MDILETAPAVHVRELCKDYGNGHRIGPLSFTVPAGSITGFVGHNGAGKTTTIRMLLGLIAATEGTADILGHDLRDRVGYLPSVGALVEGPTFYDGLSARRNLLIHARLGNIPTDRIGEVLAEAGLADRADDRVGDYSLGMRQRLGIAAALLPRPTLLILDEPANGLDPQGTADLRTLLRRLADDGITCFISSHLLMEMEQLCDHLVALHQGAVVFEGSPETLTGGTSDALRLQLRPDDPADLPALAEVVAALGHTGREEAGWLHFSAPGEAAAICNAAAMRAGITLAELRLHRTSLEEAFFRLTAAQEPPPEAATAHPRPAVTTGSRPS
ncbi:ABC transporter ATP-binding protein [Streptomyces uncialis]|uniref:ABC transporter ATP-binding protein n=1 Tax=Streptomyces uncialis TaxID=1048205 RepID=UPI00382D5228